MTEQNNHEKKPKYSDQLKKYPLGQGNYFQGIPTPNGMHYWGYVEGTHYNVECKDIIEFQKIIPELITKSKIKRIAQSVREEEIALRIKENGLEKTSKDLGGQK